MHRRDFLSLLTLAGLSPAVLRAQGMVPRAPADAWPQFRGTPSLSGLSSTTLPPEPKLAWTWEGGESIDSSPAVVDGVVYIGGATGELFAIGLADGKLRWMYKAGESIGESSPAVAAGLVYIGDLDGVVHAVSAATGKAAWTFRTKSEIKSSPVVAGDLLLIGSIMVISGFVGILTGSEALMLLLAVGLSVLYIAVGRKKIRRKITTITTKTNVDKLIGSTGTVVRDIDPDRAGIIRVNDEEWRASAEEVLYERDTVVIEAVEGVTVIVRKLSK